MKRILYISGLSLFAVLYMSSCKLDEFNPNSLSEENALRNFDGWKAYQSNCYTGLWGSLIGLQYGIVSEAGTDLWTFPFNNHNQYRDVLAYEEFTTSSGVVRNVWDFAWGPIKDCNKTIELSTQLPNGSPDDIKVLVAETKLLRGYYYSVLVAQFGKVPLYTTTSATTILNPTRDSISKIYAQIISDLRTAFNDLKVTPFENNPQRVTKKTALGLLARVYAQGAGEGLTEGGKSYWLRAKEVADSLITNKSIYSAALYDDFAKVFASANNRNNTEALFTAYGLNPFNTSYDLFTGAGKPNIYLHYYPKFDDAFGTADIFNLESCTSAKSCSCISHIDRDT